MNARESLSAMDEAMLVRGLKGSLRQSKSCENLVALGLFDDISLELTKEGRKVACDILKEQKEKAKNGSEQKVYTQLVLSDIEVEVDNEIIEDDIFDGDVDDDFGLSSFNPLPV